MKTRVEGYEDHRALGLKPGDIAWFYQGAVPGTTLRR
jgi:hypothetical protein